MDVRCRCKSEEMELYRDSLQVKFFEFGFFTKGEGNEKIRVPIPLTSFAWHPPSSLRIVSLKWISKIIVPFYIPFIWLSSEGGSMVSLFLWSFFMTKVVATNFPKKRMILRQCCKFFKFQLFCHELTPMRRHDTDSSTTR